MTYISLKWPKYLRNDHKNVGKDVDLWEIAKKCVKWLKYLTNGFIN